ncbi:MAG: helix-turn-helix domain-containing protein [Acidimicrobiales bacterium]|nr:helix-turn-helix domain-containing protein [Acidimicrobiales bacterium]
MRSRDLRLVYTVAEAAELLGIGRSTAYELVNRGELATTRLGSRVVVTRPTLTTLLGFDPPLPGELDDARDAIATRSKQPTKAGNASRPRRLAVDGQTHLPFIA